MPPAPLILHAGALGDLVLTLHLAERISALQRAERIDVYARFPLEDAHRRGAMWRFHHFERHRPERLYADDGDVSAWADRLRGRFVLSALGGIDSVVHRNLRRCGAAAVVSIDPVIRDDTGRHVVERWAAQVQAQGEVTRLCSRGTGPVGPRGRHLVIHPGSGGREKCWHLDGFIEVAAGWDGRVTFVLGEVERERWTEQDLARIADARWCATLPDLVAVLRAADVFLGNDSGPAHLAAWLDVPTLALFGPTDPRTWRPRGGVVDVLRGDITQPGWGIAAADVVMRLTTFAGGNAVP